MRLFLFSLIFVPVLGFSHDTAEHHLHATPYVVLLGVLLATMALGVYLRYRG